VPPEFHLGPLKKDRQFLTFQYATVLEADADFYEAYDALFLVRKARLLYRVYEDSIASSSASRNGDASPARDEVELRTLLATELHCAAYHQTEALIALILAEYQDKPDWVYLTTYGNSEPKEAAKAMAKRVVTIPHTTASNLRQLVKEGVYANWDLSKTEFAAVWDTSIQSIMALLEIVSEQFVDGHEYNSYKHGLRVVLGSAALGIAPDGTTHNVSTVAAMPHAMTFLQIEKLGKDYGAHTVTKEVKPEYSLEVIECMGSLLTTIKTFRLARTKGTLPSEVQLPMYDTVLLDRIKPMTKFGFSY
jgi:hypothetical protein